MILLLFANAVQRSVYDLDKKKVASQLHIRIYVWDPLSHSTIDLSGIFEIPSDRQTCKTKFSKSDRVLGVCDCKYRRKEKRVKLWRRKSISPHVKSVLLVLGREPS